MIKYTSICLVLCSSALTAQSKKSTSDFDAWLSSQYEAINDPVEFVCTQACTLQYSSCLSKFHFNNKKPKKFAELPNSPQCTSLWESCNTKCVQGLANSTTNSGGSSGGSTDSGGSDGGGSGGSNGGDVVTPPDTDPTDDETNNSGGSDQPPVL
jgi:uncharacterized membrane protein YgcG